MCLKEGLKVGFTRQSMGGLELLGVIGDAYLSKKLADYLVIKSRCKHEMHCSKGICILGWLIDIIATLESQGAPDINRFSFLSFPLRLTACSAFFAA